MWENERRPDEVRMCHSIMIKARLIRRSHGWHSGCRRAGRKGSKRINISMGWFTFTSELNICGNSIWAAEGTPRHTPPSAYLYNCAVAFVERKDIRSVSSPSSNALRHGRALMLIKIPPAARPMRYIWTDNASTKAWRRNTNKLSKIEFQFVKIPFPSPPSVIISISDFPFFYVLLLFMQMPKRKIVFHGKPFSITRR